jgi:hypothetical protein
MTNAIILFYQILCLMKLTIAVNLVIILLYYFLLAYFFLPF